MRLWHNGNYFEFHQVSSQKKRREEKTNDNRKQIPPTLKPTILYEKKLISNVKKNEKSNTLERNNLEKISNKYKYPISQNRKEQIL